MWMTGAWRRIEMGETGQARNGLDDNGWPGEGAKRGGGGRWD